MTTKANLAKLKQVQKDHFGWVTVGALKKVWYLDSYFDNEGKCLDSLPNEDVVYFEGRNGSYFVIYFEADDGEQVNFGISEDSVKFKMYGKDPVITQI